MDCGDFRYASDNALRSSSLICRHRIVLPACLHISERFTRRLFSVFSCMSPRPRYDALGRGHRGAGRRPLLSRRTLVILCRAVIRDRRKTVVEWQLLSLSATYLLVQCGIELIEKHCRPSLYLKHSFTDSKKTVGWLFWSIPQGYSKKSNILISIMP